MHILFLTTYFKPDITANGILLTQLSEALAQMGHKITVVTTMPHYSTNRIWAEYRGRLWRHETQGLLNVHRVYLYLPSDKKDMIGRLLSYASFNILSTLIALLAGPYDLVFVPSPPLTNGLAGFVISRLRKVPYIYNVQDIYPDIAIRLGALHNLRIISFFQAMERFVYNSARAVSVISRGFQDNLLAKGVPLSKTVIIPNFADPDFIIPLPRQNSFSVTHNLDGRFVALFAGNIGLSQGLSTVLEAARILAGVPEILFLIVGSGASRQELEAQAQQWGLRNVRFLPFQSHTDVPLMYASADVCLATLRHGVSQESVPSKVFTIMAAARPLVACVDIHSDTWQVAQDAGCGLCVEPENAQGLAEAIMSLYKDRESAAQMGKRGRDYVVKYYSLNGIAKRYNELFLQVVNGGISTCVNSGNLR